MNRLHALTLIQRTVFEDRPVEVKDVFMKLRFLIPNGGDNEVLARKDIEAFAENCMRQLKDLRFPVEFERMRIDILEGELRADLLDAIGELDLSDPNDCRELFELHRAVGSSTGSPTLMQAIDALAAGGIHEDRIKALTERYLALYPKPVLED